MSQIPYFINFLNNIPNLEALAKVDEKKLLKCWQGLGYYRRARSLHSAAKEILEKFNGKIPLEKEDLLSIKGIGEYTASALRAIGADKKDLAVDANLERVIARYYAIDEKKGLKLQRKVRSLFDAGEICTDIETWGARKYNEALMDVGRRICQARSAACEICPLKENCQGRKNPLKYPVSESIITESFELHLLRIIVREKNKILVYKKNQNQWLSGQYEIPTFNLWSEDKTFTQYPKLHFKNYGLLPFLKTGITKYKILNFVLEANMNDIKLLDIDPSNFSWMDLGKIHLSTASHKCLSFIDK